MTSRDEKERRRQERLAAEEAAEQSSQRRKRLGIVGGAVLAAAVVAVVVIAVTSGGGGGGDDDGSKSADVPIPAPREQALAPAARAAGCTLDEPKVAGSEHTSEAVEYATNPPTSGDHDPVAAQDGIYDPGNPPDVEQSVHALEHGRINVQYAKGTPERFVGQLETLVSESVKGDAGYHTLLFENQTTMETAVAATAWGRSLTCPEPNDRVFDALRAFRREAVDKAPEFIP